MIKLASFKRYQKDITSMMMDMLHLEPQPVDIPVERYIELQKMGYLLPFLWLDDDEPIIKGVALLFKTQSLRNNAVCHVSTDVIWVKPEYRGNSSEFIDDIRLMLKDMGVDYWMISSRDTHPIDKFLEKNNFDPLERVYFCQL